MSKIMRVGVLVAGLVSLFAAAGAASASTWHNSGGTTFTGTGGPGSLSVGANTLSCTSDQNSGTAGTSSAGPTWIAAVRGGVTWIGCRIGGTPWHAYCPNFQLDALAWNSSTDIVSGNVVINSPGCLAGPGTTPGTNDLCRIDGRTTFAYANRTHTLTVNGTSSLVVSNNGANVCPSALGTGAGTLTTMVIVITSANPPNVRQP